MTHGGYRKAAKLFHLLSHQARLHILDELRKDEACVCHLQTVLHRPQAYVSQQLRVLREAGVVADRKDGVLVFYRLDDLQVNRVRGFEQSLWRYLEREQPSIARRLGQEDDMSDELEADLEEAIEAFRTTFQGGSWKISSE